VSNFELDFQFKTKDALNTNSTGFETIQTFEKELSEKEAFKLALRKGAKIPSFTLPDVINTPISIEGVYLRHTLVLVFTVVTGVAFW
jgi:hypothetical protein